jgi:hypothetical protein
MLKIRIHKETTLPVVYYGYEKWSRYLWEEFKLQLSETRYLRKHFKITKIN